MIEFLLSKGAVVDDVALCTAFTYYSNDFPECINLWGPEDDSQYVQWCEKLFGRESNYAWPTNEEEHDFSSVKTILRYVCSAAGNVNMDIKADCPLYAHLATQYRCCPIDMDLLDLMHKAGFKNMDLAAWNFAINTFDEERTIECINEIVDKEWHCPNDDCVALPLHFACRFGCLKAAKHLIGIGAKRITVDRDGLTPFANFLLHQSPNENQLNEWMTAFAPDLRGFNLSENVPKSPFGGALHLIFKMGAGHADCVRELINLGASVDDADTDGNTPLHIACRAYSVAFDDEEFERRCLAIFELFGGLLEWNPCLVHSKNYKGQTAFHIATELAIIDILVEAEANVNAQDDNGCTALHIAVRGDLVAHVFGRKYPGEFERYEYQLMMAEHLLDKGVDPKLTDSNGNTPLLVAIKTSYSFLPKNWYDLCKLLFEGGGEGRVDPNLTDSNGDTPLLVAIKTSRRFTDENWYDLCKLLLEGGADVNAVDQNGDYVIHWVCQLCLDERMNSARWETISVHLEKLDRFVKLLVEYGANINRTNEAHKTPLMMAWHQVRQLQVREMAKKDSFRVDWDSVCAIFEFLINDHGADPRIQDDNGNSLLHMMCIDLHMMLHKSHTYSSFMEKSYSLTKLIQLAMDKGCNPDQLNSESESPIMIYARHKHAKLDILFHMVSKVAAEYGTAPTILV